MLINQNQIPEADLIQTFGLYTFPLNPGGKDFNFDLREGHFLK